ncbi:hypothetical protein HaLaN_10439, partial [Haematococcus lacustris]
MECGSQQTCTKKGKGLNQFRPARHEKDSNLRSATRPANLSGKELPLRCVVNTHLFLRRKPEGGHQVANPCTQKLRDSCIAEKGKSSVRSTLTVKH